MFLGGGHGPPGGRRECWDTDADEGISQHSFLTPALYHLSKILARESLPWPNSGGVTERTGPLPDGSRPLPSVLLSEQQQ